jgi:hypothetical protein
MKQSLLLFCILIICGCIKEETIIQQQTPFKEPAIEQVSDSACIMMHDTTLNYPNVWDGNNKTISISNWKIHGNGAFINWDIDASVNQIIFDTSINLKGIRTAKTPFSTIWYGTNSSNADNWWNIQKSINVCINNHLECFTPGDGVYKYSKPLEISSLINNSYQQVSIHFFGDASMWDNGQGTTFQYTGKTGCGINLQLNKGTELNNFLLFGLYKAPVGNDSAFFSNTSVSFKDISGNNLPDNYFGISIDGHVPPDGSISGTTGTHLHDVGIGNFAMLLCMSPNGITANDDIMRVENLHLYDGKYGIVNGQAQEKDMRFSGIYSWGNIFELINIGHFGKAQAGEYTFDGGNIAGRCINFCDISVSHWFSTHITNFFCENIGSVGIFSAQQPITIDYCNFDLNFSFNKQRCVINSNSSFVSFEQCVIRYYDGLINNVYVHGSMTIQGPPVNYFGGGNLIYK